MDRCIRVAIGRRNSTWLGAVLKANECCSENLLGWRLRRTDPASSRTNGLNCEGLLIRDWNP